MADEPELVDQMCLLTTRVTRPECRQSMSRSLLDTDVLSEIIKGKNTAILARANVYLAEHGRFTTSAVSVPEIIYGFRRKGREDRLVQFESSLASVEVIPFEDASGRLEAMIDVRSVRTC